MALNWGSKDGIVTSVLVGASKPEQILDNLKVLGKVHLFTDEELKKIERIESCADAKESASQVWTETIIHK